MLKSFTRSTCGQMRLNNIALCQVHKAILDKLDIEKLMQEFVLRRQSSVAICRKYFNLMLITQNVLLKWFDEWQKSTRSQANGGKGKGEQSIAVRKKPHRYGNSRAIWDHTVLPATRQR